MMGRLCADPELQKTPNDISVATFRIAVDRPYKVKGEKKTDFFTCIAWRHIGEHVAKYFRKGKIIHLDGHFETRDYENKNGIKIHLTEMIVESVCFAGDRPKEKNLPEPPPEPNNGQAQSGTESSADFSEVTPDSGDLPF